MTRKHIYLTGFMGSGKSRIGKILAKKLCKDFFDTDDLIEGEYQKSVKQIFDMEGEQKFRESENKVIKRLSDQKGSIVISLGGGALVYIENQRIVQSTGILIYIKSGLEEIWQRVKNKTKRPLLLNEGEMLNKEEFMTHATILMDQRKNGYEKADIVIDRTGLEAEDIVDILITKIHEF